MADLPCMLMVDDNPADHQLIRLACDDAGLRVEQLAAYDGRQAQVLLQAMAAGKPAIALVLLDLNMPGIDGRQVLAWARAQPPLRNLPILVLTSSQAPTDRRDALALGASGFLIKPGDYAGLVPIVERIRQVLATTCNVPNANSPPTGSDPG